MWMRWLLLTLGAMFTGTGLYAYFTPEAFFEQFAARTGEYNVHLMRDVGAAYLAAGVSLLWAAAVERWRAPFTVAAAIFLVLHALIHAFEIGEGHVGESELTTELFGVLFPSTLVGGLAVWFMLADRRNPV